MFFKYMIVAFIVLVPSIQVISYAHEHGEEWNPLSAGPITTWTAPLCGKGKLVLQPFIFYNKTRGTFNPQGHYDALPDGDKKYQYQEVLFLQYGLTDKLEIDLQGTYQQNYVSQGGLKAHSQGWADSYSFLRYCVLEDEGWVPQLTTHLQAKIPSGKYQKLDSAKLGTDSMGASSGGGFYDYGLGINLSKKLKPVIMHLDTVYSLPIGTKVDGIKTEYGKYLNYDFGIEYFLPKGFNLMLEFNGFLQGDKKQDGSGIPNSDLSYLNIAPGIGWSSSKIQTLIAYQRTLIGTNSDANDSIVLTCVYTF